MGDSGLISKEDREKSRVEPFSLTKIFEEWCPIYMSYGMSYDEYWHGDAYVAKFYREAFELNNRHRDEEFWMQGMYVYDAICRVAPILHAFSKSGTKPLPYPEKPYMAQMDNHKTPEEKAQEEENARLVARLHFEQWARMTAERFNKQENIDRKE